MHSITEQIDSCPTLGIQSVDHKKQGRKSLKYNVQTLQRISTTVQRFGPQNAPD